jgi:hypothetical protein
MCTQAAYTVAHKHCACQCVVHTRPLGLPASPAGAPGGAWERGPVTVTGTAPRLAVSDVPDSESRSPNLKAPASVPVSFLSGHPDEQGNGEVHLSIPVFMPVARVAMAAGCGGLVVAATGTMAGQ